MAEGEPKDPGWSPPRPIRPGQRIPSGPRPAPSSRDSYQQPSAASTSRASSSTSIPLPGAASPRKARHVPSLTSLAALGMRSESPLDALIDNGADFTTNPEQSPPLFSASPPTSPRRRPKEVTMVDTTPRKLSDPRLVTSPTSIRPLSPTGPSSSSSSLVEARARPQPLKVNTNLAAPISSPSKPVSPSLKHWQQVRSHVISTPIDEKAALQQAKGKKQGIVSKAAGKFGFRQAADHVIGYDDRRKSLAVVMGDLGDLSLEEREEIARERRRFARDIKTCLEGCMAEDSRRRLIRASGGTSSVGNGETRHRASSIPLNTMAGPSNYKAPDVDFSAYAPLLKEFSNYANPARAKKPWCRTCAHHGAILGELATAFLPDNITTPGERQQTLEVFVALVEQWAPENADEELDRWLFLCNALRVDDRQLRTRGLGLLQAMLHDDPALPQGDRPHTAASFQAIALGLLGLLCTLKRGTYDTAEHYRIVSDLLVDLAEGQIMDVEQESLEQVIGQVGILESAGGGIEKELLWLATGKGLGMSRPLAAWLVVEQPQILSSFAPPPILHAAPPLVIRLRILATAIHLDSLASMMDSAEESDLGTTWSITAHRIEEAEQLPKDDMLAQAVGRSLVAAWRRLPPPNTQGNPFGDPSSIQKVSSASPFDPIRTFRRYLALVDGKATIDLAFRSVVQARPIEEAVILLHRLLETEDCRSMGQSAVALLFSRLNEVSADSPKISMFLSYLAVSHPQLLYKPLFSLSASSQPSTLVKHLRVVRALSSILSPARFWTAADPQMVVILLMGDSTPKLAKGKGKEGDTVAASVKLGRYAVLLELLAALDAVSEPANSGTRLRTFIETLEGRIGAMLEAEDAAGGLTPWYKALISAMFFKLRSLTKSLRRSPWQHLILSWFIDSLSASPHTTPSDAPANIALRGAWQDLVNPSSTNELSGSTVIPRADSMTSPPLKPGTMREDTVNSANAVPVNRLFDLSTSGEAAKLLVLINPCLTSEDWARLVVPLWRNLSEDTAGTLKPIAFLLMKCGQLATEQLNGVILSDLQSPNGLQRAMALRKLARLYGYRFQILSQPILSDRRGPTFHWMPRVMDFVTTEIGSPMWTAPQDVQDAALQKFGNNLPLELRQRLMQLGWSDDANIADELDTEKMPVSSLPSSQWMDKEPEKEIQSQKRTLTRRGSSGSEASTTTTKRRKAVYAPIMTLAIHDSASMLSREGEEIVEVLSHDLVRMLQRDDPAHLLRPFSDRVLQDFSGPLARLNAVAISATPGFAYAAFNALVGYLKHVLRDHQNHPAHAPALSAIALLAPHVSEISLRDVRKNKAEPVLLPASIHEEQGGIKLHIPWQGGSIAVQTAQLRFLTECLKANSREVYLIKKMLSNLPITPSAPDLYFARAWLMLVNTLFGTLNRNYNDRSELRHFLANATFVLRHHQKDLFVIAHAMKVFMLCSARFRRLFATVGFSTIMRSVYEVYASGDPAVRDCVEYACRSFYRIHEDAFVFQTIVAISEGDFDPAAAYALLSSLAVGNSPISGASSGIRGLNDAEEIDALVHMLSGPEIALHEIGTDRTERQAAKMSAMDKETTPFPKENIVKLLVTAIAANPSAARSGRWLRLFSGMVPHITDTASRDLLREGVEALGVLIARARSADEAAIAAFHGSAEGEAPDWIGARREYIRLVDAYAAAGGSLGVGATKVVLEIVLDLLQKEPGNVGPAAAGILRELTKTHLASSRATSFLRDIAPLYGQFAAVVDFSGVLESITDYIERSAYEIHPDMAHVIITSYVEPSVRLLSAPPGETGLLGTPLRMNIVRLLCAAVLIHGDAFSAVESQPRSASLLASLVMSFALLLEAPRQVDRATELSSLWIRVLNYVSKQPSPSRTPKSANEATVTAVLCLQIVKIVTLRAPSAISEIQGLWTYIATHLLRIVAEGDGKFAESGVVQAPPRVVDWMMWSIFELLALHPSPLMITFRHHIQIHLSNLHHSAMRSRPSTPGSKTAITFSSPMMSGRARMASARSPSMALHARTPSRTPSPEPSGHHCLPSAGRWTPESSGHARIPSTHLTPHLGHSRNFSGSLSVPGATRPSFADLSARRASRPVFDGLPSSPGGLASNAMRFRFPSSAPIRNLNSNEKGSGGAIIHLLGAPAQVLSATSTAFPTLAPSSRKSATHSALRDIRLRSPALIRGAKRAVRNCMVMFGYTWEAEDDEDAVRVWSSHDAITEVAEQTRIFLEKEFKDVFMPAAEQKRTTAPPDIYVRDAEKNENPGGGYLLDQIIPRSSNEYNEKEYDDGYHLLHDHDQDRSFESKEGNHFEIPRLAVTTP